MVKIDLDERNMVLVSKVFLGRVPGKRVPLRRTTEKAKKKYSCLVASFTRVLKVRFEVRYPLTTTCLAKWGDTWGERLGCIGFCG